MMISLYHLPSEEKDQQIKRLEKAYGEVDPNAIDIEDITVQYEIENDMQHQHHHNPHMSEGPNPNNQEEKHYHFDQQNHIDGS